MFVCLSDPQAVAEVEMCTKSEIPTKAVTIMSTCYSTDVSRYQNAGRQNTITVRVALQVKILLPFPKRSYVCLPLKTRGNNLLPENVKSISKRKDFN